MEKTATNKLAVILKGGFGKELDLLGESTTIGSAPDNDIRLKGKSVSGFHAELRIKNNNALLVDFNSEAGTFLNGERIDKEATVEAGDTIRIGSTRAIFLPRNAIIVKEKAKSRKPAAESTVLTPRVKKTFVFVCFALAIMSGLKIAGEKMVDTAETSSASAAVQKNVEVPVAVPEVPSMEDEKRPPDVEPQTEEITADEIDRQVQRNSADIYFSVAGNFSKERLWDSALEYYEKVFEIDSDYPGLSGQIAQVKNEMENKNAYEQGKASIDQGNYEDGLSLLQTIDRDSAYFKNSNELITVANKKEKEEKKASQKKHIQPKNKPNEVAEGHINKALALYGDGKLELSLLEVSFVQNKLKKTDKAIKARAKNIYKRIALSKAFYDEGDNKSNLKEFAAALAAWEKFLDVDKTLVSHGKSHLAQTVHRKKIDVYNSMAHAAYAAGDFVKASTYNKLAFKTNPDSTESLKMRRMLDEKTKQLYEEGYILEGYNRSDRACEKWQQVLKISGPKSEYYKKALEKLSQR